MKNVANLVGYQLVWLAVVWTAGRGSSELGIAACVVFVSVQLAFSQARASDATLVLLALALGLIVDGSLARSGLVRYAAFAAWMPAPFWILALWAAFAMTFNHSLAWLRGRPGASALLGAIGGPLAYLGAARGFGAVSFAAPPRASLIALAIGWGAALAVLSLFAGYRKRSAAEHPTA
jgi:hypothetical protein